PPQPSSPHERPVQSGVHVTHCPDALQVYPNEQVPHEPPQPSDPQLRPLQSGVHTTQLQFTQLPPVQALPSSLQRSSGQEAEVPEQVSAMSHSFAAARHTVPAAANWSGGQEQSAA